MKVVIFGCGENGFQAYHAMRHDPDLDVIGFLDGNPEKHGTEMLGLPVLGDFGEIPNLMRTRGLGGAIPAVGDNWIRSRIARTLREHDVEIVSAIHPTVMIESPERIGEGVILEMGAAIHAGGVIGDGVFMGTSAIVAHHSTVGEYATLSGGVSFGGRVSIGSYTLVGVGASIHPHISVGSNVIVGVGAAVVKDVPDNTVVVGVPAKFLRELPPLADIYD
jgi:UDP-perosamine 4-acetyltransferase